MDREIINILLRIREARGLEVFSDLKKCRSFLADYAAGKYRAESRAMLLGLEEKFYDRLRGAGALTATDVCGLEKRLISAYLLNEPAASFIVRGWCEVFGVRCQEPVLGQGDASLSKSHANSIGMEFVLIPAGEFMMGSPDGDEEIYVDEKPQHRVTISRPFYLGKYEVTQSQWEAVMGDNPSWFKGQRNNPVEMVSWDDVQAFINKLNQREGSNQYRLPTEAEWEYAARAGTTSKYPFGDDAEALGRYAWYLDNSGETTHPVAGKEPNAWGMYDMHGNVCEWVQDWYGGYASSSATDPRGPSSGSYRVVRGGAWRNDAGRCRSAYRSCGTPDIRNDNLGFRLVFSKSHANSIGMEFELIPAGEFMMGSPDTDKDAFDREKPQHRVTVSKPFYLGKYEVTQAQWEVVMGSNPSRFKGQNNPVEMVSWDDVQAFISKLNQQEGVNKYRLPTEAEWEYVARAGTMSTYLFGDDAEALGRYAWYKDNSGRITHPVGQKEPNAWGLYDMHGNVCEWVQDWYGDYSGSSATDPQGPSSGSCRVVRGGAWRNSAMRCRSVYRLYFTPGNRRNNLGFRLAFSPGQ